MFVPVNCTKCGKPFQVPESALGQLTPCPWCQEVVTALPVSAPQQSAPKQRPASPVPLSLDDEPAPPPKQDRPPSQPLRRLLILSAGLVGMLLVTFLTVGVLQRKEGRFIALEWRNYTAPDGSCSIDLLGKPVEDLAIPETGGRLYVSEGWYSGARAWIGWKDLSPVEAQLAGSAEAWRLLRPVVFDPEKERLKSTYGGYETEGSGTKSFEPLVVEFRFQTPDGLLVERAIVKPSGTKPRIYFIGILGKRLTPESPEIQRFFSSFKIHDPG